MTEARREVVMAAASVATAGRRVASRSASRSFSSASAPEMKARTSSGSIATAAPTPPGGG